MLLVSNIPPGVCPIYGQGLTFSVVPVYAHTMNNTEAALNIAARLNDGQTFTNHPTHDFTGFDGRCMWCDSRPFGRHAPNPCPAR